MALLDCLRAELDTGAPRLRGAEVRARIPLRQAVLDQLLARTPGLPQGVAVVLGTDGRLQVQYGAFHANARLRSAATLRPRPEVTLELASQLVAWGLARVTLPSFVRVEGRLVRVALDQGPLAVLRPYWAHVRALSFRSLQDGLEIDVEIRVSGELPS